LKGISHFKCQCGQRKAVSRAICCLRATGRDSPI